MKLQHKIISYNVECKRIIIVDNENIIDDTLICYADKEAFLYVKNGSVERFEAPPIKQEKEQETQTETQE